MDLLSFPRPNYAGRKKDDRSNLLLDLWHLEHLEIDLSLSAQRGIAPEVSVHGEKKKRAPGTIINQIKTRKQK
jgi:hypothetical protein